jgi:hypothetical protein
MLSALQWGCIGVGIACVFGLAAVFYAVMHNRLPWEDDE